MEREEAVGNVRIHNGGLVLLLCLGSLVTLPYKDRCLSRQICMDQLLHFQRYLPINQG